MTSVLPGDVCPKTGTWVPSNNRTFYPSDYFQEVMLRYFEVGELMPATPHGEPSWIFQEQGKPLENFSGLTPEQIKARSDVRGGMA